MLLVLLLLVLAVFIIWKSSDWVTISLVPVAKKLGTSYIAVTTLIISFVISMPEVISAVYSYFSGYLELGLGVVIGSVMVNIGLTVGLSALIKPLQIEKGVVLRDGIYMIVVAVIVLLFGQDLTYTKTEGIVLWLLFIPYAINVWAFEKGRSRKSRKEVMKRVKDNFMLIGKSKIKLNPSPRTFIIGAVALIFGSYLFAFSLVKISEMLPLPKILVGLVIGALGTGAPNIAVAIQGTLKGYKDAAITETFGSNIFTLLITLGTITVLAPFTIKGSVFYFDLTWMIVLNLLLVAFIFKGYRYKEESLTRYDGAILLLFYLILLVIHSFLF